jgi:hypothetical protein
MTMKKTTLNLALLLFALAQFTTTGHAEQAKQPLDTLPLSSWATPPAMEAWQAALDNDFQAYEEYWQLNNALPFTVKAQNKQGQPVANAQVRLMDEQGAALWSSWSCKNGTALLWGPGTGAAKQLIVSLGNRETSVAIDGNFSSGETTTLVLDVPCQELQGADIRFLLDATHSMRDEFAGLLNLLTPQDYPICLARDIGERFLLQDISSGSAPAFTIQAAGGGSDEEAMDTLLLAALAHTDWDTAAPARVLVYLTDAKPARMPEASVRMRRAIQLAAREGVAIWPVACSGLDAEGEYLLQSMALQTGGQYAWLEDNPGSTELHRWPILSGDAVRSDLSTWLQTQTKKIDDFYSCTSDQPKAPAVAQSAPAAFGCFPNPARTEVTLKVPAFAERITLYNTAGQPVRDWKAVEVGETTFSVAQLPAGQYSLEAAAGPERWGASLVVVR